MKVATGGAKSLLLLCYAALCPLYRTMLLLLPDIIKAVSTTSMNAKVGRIM